MIKVRMVHVRAAKMCSPGARAFFKKHGLNWTQFLKEGIAIEELELIDDAMSLQVCKVAREWEAAKNKQ
jgi:hypothetical protein